MCGTVQVQVTGIASEVRGHNDDRLSTGTGNGNGTGSLGGDELVTDVAAKDDLSSVCNYDYPSYFFSKGCKMSGDTSLLGLAAANSVILVMLCVYFRKHRRLPGQIAASNDLEAPLNSSG